MQRPPGPGQAIPRTAIAFRSALGPEAVVNSPGETKVANATLSGKNCHRRAAPSTATNHCAQTARRERNSALKCSIPAAAFCGKSVTPLIIHSLPHIPRRTRLRQPLLSPRGSARYTSLQRRPDFAASAEGLNSYPQTLHPANDIVKDRLNSAKLLQNEDYSFHPRTPASALPLCRPETCLFAAQ